MARGFIDTQLKRLIARGRRVPRIRRLLEEEAIRNIPFSVDLLSACDWSVVDPLLTASRRRLFPDPVWRYGPLRVLEVAKEAFDGLRRFAAVPYKRYCDLGCGAHHPFGTAAVMYMNGASSTLSIDMTAFDSSRAAEALHDTLMQGLSNPEEWHWSDIPQSEFIERVRTFDLPALHAGNLERGIARTTLRHVLRSMTDAFPRDEVVDHMSSRAVLEHFLDLPSASRQMFNMLSPGGVAFHAIDLVDHRVYEGGGVLRPEGLYHYWSFLAEDDDWTDGVVNRLRAHEIKRIFEDTGFEILEWQTKRAQLPRDFRAKLRGRFRMMTDEELEPYGVNCVIRRPAGRPR